MEKGGDLMLKSGKELSDLTSTQRAMFLAIKQDQPVREVNLWDMLVNILVYVVLSGMISYIILEYVSKF